jgi:hypothetical protein
MSQVRCSAKVDIEFVVDGSASISSSDWKSDLAFLIDMVGSFRVGKNASEFGLVQFSSQAVQELSLRQCHNGCVDDQKPHADEWRDRIGSGPYRSAERSV